MALVLMEARFVMKRLVWKGLAFIMENGRVKYLSINLSTPTAAPTRKGILTRLAISLSSAFWDVGCCVRSIAS